MDPEFIQIPRDYYKEHRFATLAVDVIFVNGISFFVNFPRDIRFLTSKYLPSWKAMVLSSTLTKVVKLYAQSGFLSALS